MHQRISEQAGQHPCPVKLVASSQGGCQLRNRGESVVFASWSVRSAGRSVLARIILAMNQGGWWVLGKGTGVHLTTLRPPHMEVWDISLPLSGLHLRNELAE